MLSLVICSALLGATEGPPGVVPWWAPLSVGAELGFAVGSGTFVSSRFADDPYWSSSIGVSSKWSLGDARSLSIDLEASYEFTYLVTPCRAASSSRPAGAPALDCSDANDYGRRGQFEDIDLSYSDDELLLFDVFTLGGRAGISLPTGYGSIAARNLFTLRGGLVFSAEFDFFKPSIGLGFSKFFPTREGRALNAEDLPDDLPIGRCASFRQTDCVLLAGFVPSWRAGFDAGAEVQLSEQVSLGVGFGYRYSRSFGRAPDAATSPRRDSFGNIIADGVSSSDTTSGDISLTYSIDDAWSATFGLSSAQPAKTADNQALRFPFYDFISPGNNYSAWYLSLSYSFSGSSP